VGDRVTVQGRAVTLVVSQDGSEQLGTAELKLASSGW
jgi:hypothetical protein